MRALGGRTKRRRAVGRTLDMRPGFSINDVMDQPSADAILISKPCLNSSTSFRLFSNFKNLFLAKFVLWIGLTNKDWRRRCATLLKHIVHIVVESSKKKMFWPNAFPIIAFVTNQKPIGNRPAENFIGCAMHSYSPLAAPSSLDLSVSTRVKRPGPFPAPARFFYSRQKAICQSLGFPGHGRVIL